MLKPEDIHITAQLCPFLIQHALDILDYTTELIDGE